MAGFRMEGHISHVRIIILFMPIFTDTHALVKFLEEEATSIVPVK